MSYEEEHGSSLGSSLIVFLLGVAVGATVAILYAPAAGEETRANIADKAGQLKDRAGELTTTVKDKALELKDKAVAKIKTTTPEADEFVDEVKDSAHRVADTVKSEAKNIGNAAHDL